jgi:PKD repeat protein
MRAHRSIATAIATAIVGVSMVAGTVIVGAEGQQAALGDPSVRFTASGDFSSTPNSFSVFNAIGAMNPDLHLALGDLSYSTTGNEQVWCDLVTARVGAGFPFELISGNHESNGENGNINDFSACLPNQLPALIGTYGRQYYVDVPADAPLVRYVMISPGLTYPDGAWSYAAGSARYNWTAAAIDGARSANIPWVVVGMHKPCLSMGAYNCDPGAELINMLVQKRVDLVLSGHEHLYQRSKQLATTGACTGIVPNTVNAACIADSDANMVKGAGTVFVTVGTGGVPFRDVNTADSEAGYFATYSGLNANPTWGSLDVTATATDLTASFARAAGGTFTDSFTFGPAGPPTNNPPIAEFSATTTNLTANFNATASTDSDGTISGFSWNFGDSTTGGGLTASHAYAAAGTYTVTLTVTDNEGATGVISHPVTVSAPTGTEQARDDFARTVASGWGTAPVGGLWTIGGTASALKVQEGTGQVNLPPGSTRTATLAAVSTTSTDIRVAFSLDKVPTGSGSYATVVGRQVGSANYVASVWVKSTGALVLVVKQGATILSNTPINGITYTAGAVLSARVQVTGTSPTTIRAKVWVAAQTEPAGWLSSVTDSTAGLQTSGQIGLQAYLSSTATSAVVTKFDDLLAVPAP